MHTDANYNFLKAVNSHVKLPQDTAAVEAKGKIKDMAKAGQFSGKPSALAGEVLGAMAEEAKMALPMVESLQRNIYNWEKGNLPDIPQTIIGWVLPEEYTHITYMRGDEEVKEKFLAKDTGEDDPERILVFGTPKALKCM